MESKKKLNILIFSWRGPGHPSFGGAEISTHEHAMGWVQAGHSVVLFTSSFKGAKNQEVVDGVKIIRQGNQVFEVQARAFFWYIFSRHPKYDLVIDQFHGLPFFTPFYIKEKKLAFIHEIAGEVWRLNPWVFPFNLIPAIIGPLFESAIFKFYKSIPFMTVSDSTKKDLAAFGIPENNISVIHNGVSVPSKVIATKDKRPTFLFLGALTKDKGVKRAVELFFQLKKKIPDAQFWFVGKGEVGFLTKIKKLIIDLNLSNNLKFFGYVTELKKFELMKKSHFLINTSVREGWGIVVLEAAAMGTPTVAFDVPGLRDSIQNNKTGVLSKDLSLEELASKVQLLLSDKEKYDKMCKDAVLWSKKFTWERSVRESSELIRRVAG